MKQALISSNQANHSQMRMSLSSNYNQRPL